MLPFENHATMIIQIMGTCLIDGEKLEHLILFDADAVAYLARKPIGDGHTPVVVESNVT